MGRPICQVISSASCCVWPTIHSIARVRSATRWVRPAAYHPGWLSVAACNALSMSALVAKGLSRYLRPSSGLSVMNVSVIGSDNLEIAGEFPVGDRLTELPFFPMPGRAIVLDERITKQRSGGHRAQQLVGRIAQRPGQAPLGAHFPLVGASLNRRIRLDLMLDTPEAGANRGRERDIGIDVGCRDTIFHALTGRTPGDDPQCRGPILDSPRGGGRRPMPRDEPRVAVD